MAEPVRWEVRCPCGAERDEEVVSVLGCAVSLKGGRLCPRCKRFLQIGDQVTLVTKFEGVLSRVVYRVPEPL